jgi:hypothetical protein
MHNYLQDMKLEETLLMLQSYFCFKSSAGVRTDPMLSQIRNTLTIVSNTLTIASNIEKCCASCLTNLMQYAPISTKPTPT